MKVLCIKSSDETAYTKKGPVKTPESMKIYCGTIYTVSKEVIGYKGEKKWVLAERPSNCRYRKNYFAPLSQLDETIIHEEKLTEIA